MQQFHKRKIKLRNIAHTGAVLSILLVLWMEIVDGIGHNIFWIHCFLQNIDQ